MLWGGGSVDVCDLVFTLGKYDLRKSDLFVRQVMQGSISSELLMCGGGVRSICIAYCG